MLCCWVEDSNSEAFKLHIPRIYDYLWIAEDGMKMQVQTVSFFLNYYYNSYFWFGECIHVSFKLIS